MSEREPPAAHRGTAVLACGALAAEVRMIARRRGWELDVHPVPALLHNRPERIAPAVRRALARLRERYDVIAVAYGDCGSYGTIDAVLSRAGVQRLTGEHCYDVFGGAAWLRQACCCSSVRFQGR